MERKIFNHKNKEKLFKLIPVIFLIALPIVIIGIIGIMRLNNDVDHTEEFDVFGRRFLNEDCIEENFEYLITDEYFYKMDGNCFVPYIQFFPSRKLTPLKDAIREGLVTIEELKEKEVPIQRITAPSIAEGQDSPSFIIYNVGSENPRCIGAQVMLNVSIKDGYHYISNNACNRWRVHFSDGRDMFIAEAVTSNLITIEDLKQRGVPLINENVGGRPPAQGTRPPAEGTRPLIFTIYNLGRENPGCIGAQVIMNISIKDGYYYISNNSCNRWRVHFSDGRDMFITEAVTSNLITIEDLKQRGVPLRNENDRVPPRPQQFTIYNFGGENPGCIGHMGIIPIPIKDGYYYIQNGGCDSWNVRFSDGRDMPITEAVTRNLITIEDLKQHGVPLRNERNNTRR